MTEGYLIETWSGRPKEGWGGARTDDRLNLPNVNLIYH